MARPQTIDRKQLLNEAERIIAASGAKALSFGNLARAVGIPKASVQSVFHSREAMIEALLKRWLKQEQKAFDNMAPDGSTFRGRVLGHIETTARASIESSSRLAAMLAALVGADAPTGIMAKWYEARVGDLSAEDDDARRLRIAFLAAEGAFFLRYIAGFPINEEQWQRVFDDLRALTSPED